MLVRITADHDQALATKPIPAHFRLQALMVLALDLVRVEVTAVRTSRTTRGNLEILLLTRTTTEDRGIRLLIQRRLMDRRTPGMVLRPTFSSMVADLAPVVLNNSIVMGLEVLRTARVVRVAQEARLLSLPEHRLRPLQPSIITQLTGSPFKHPRTDRAELARIFAPYGNIAEIVLKGSFGFVQFDSPEACTRATSESGRKLAGLSMDVKVSREKNATRREANRGGAANRRRSTTDHAGPTRRSPPRGRANERDRPRGNRNRSSSYSSTSSRGSDRHGHRRDSPRRRRRSASVSPDRKASKWGPPDVGRREVVLPTPTMSAAPVATGGFPLASRTGSAVPECQIIVLSDMDRNYIGQVEAIIRNAGIKADVINLNAGMSVHEIVYQMMAEGCRGVLFLERKHAVSKTCSLQIFQAGNTVAEYENVNPEIAALLLIRDRSVRPVVQPALSAVPQTNIASVLASLLGQQAQPQAAAAAGGGMDAQMLVTLMATLQQQQQQQQQQLAQLSQSLGAQAGGSGGGNPLAALAGLNGLAGLVPQQQPQSQAIAAQPPQQQQNLAGLLSLLAGQGGATASQQQNMAQQQQRQQTQTQQFLRANVAGSPTQSPVTPGAGTNVGAFPQSGAGSGGNPSAMAGQQQQQQQPQTQVAELLNRLKSLQQLHPGAGAGGAARS
ncbi:hypothetical protein HDU90_003832 [Geranomyces variabilis]|nr:hypothetical protein HDU90_003832 [Geranomyces variabilis]